MAFREKIDYLLLDIRELETLIAGMREAEIYPVSFFNRSFGLTHKILDDLHKLESVQLDLLRKQMEEHEALLKDLPYRNTSPVSSFAVREPDVVTGPARAAGLERPDDLSSASVSFSAVSVDEEPTDEHGGEAQTVHSAGMEEPEPILPASYAETAATEVPDSREPVCPEYALLRDDSSTSAQNDSSGNGPAQDTGCPQAASSATAPAVNAAIVSAPHNEPEPEPEAGAFSVENRPVACPSSPAASVFLGEKVAPQNLSVNEALERRKFSDFRRAFSLNDRFYFRRELFGGNESRMNQVIDRLNAIHSFDDSLAYLKQELEWNLDDQAVTDFVGLIEKRYAQ